MEMTAEAIPKSWKMALEPTLKTSEARQLGRWLRAEEAAGRVIYPPRGERLTALAVTGLESVRVVILGQDPYHGPGQAHGLAFSVKDGVKPPPSLRNMFKELESDLGIPPPETGNLTPWAKQGVLLLNNTLTVQEAQAGSHAGRGWDTITDAAVAAVAEREAPCVFILWGSHAQKKASRVRGLGRRADHLIIKSPHPSPLSAHRGFFGSKPFSQANAFLEANGSEPVDWSL